MKIFVVKLLTLSIILLSNAGCSGLNSKNHWRPIGELSQNWDKIKVGDIIIKNKTIHPMEWLGHVGVVVTPNTVGDYPNPMTGYNETRYTPWLNENRKVILLRFKGFDEEFQNKFLENVEYLKNQKYLITSNKLDENVTYCSKYVWYLFYKTADDLGIKIDLDTDGGPYVMPYDMLESPWLEIIYF